MNKQEILDRLNEIIKEEKGLPVTMNDKFMDSDLDSLAITITFLAIDAEFPILGEDTDKAWEELDIPNLTMRDLVAKCKLSITSSSTEPNSETDT